MIRREPPSAHAAASGLLLTDNGDHCDRIALQIKPCQRFLQFSLDSQLIAPVRIGNGAYVATGTTVTMDVPDEGLALSRMKQVNKLDYAPKLRARLKARADAAKAAKKLR